MIRLYMDHHVRAEITAGLRRRGIDVLTAHDDGHRDADDPAILNRATALGRTVFTQDTDFLIEAALRQQASRPFTGVVYAHQFALTIGQCIADLELLCTVYDPPDMLNRVAFLPL